jgi:hypothetical protein
MGNLPTYRKLEEAKRKRRAGEDVFAIGKYFNRPFACYVCLDTTAYVHTWLSLYRDYTISMVERTKGNLSIPITQVDTPTPLRYLSNLQTEYCNPGFLRWFCDIDSKDSGSLSTTIEQFIESLYAVLSKFAAVVNIYLWEAHDKELRGGNDDTWGVDYRIQKASYHIHAVMHNVNDEGFYEVFLPSIAAVKFICSMAVAHMKGVSIPSITEPSSQSNLIRSVVDKHNKSIIDTSVWIEGSRIFRIGGAFKTENRSRISGTGEYGVITRPFVYGGEFTDGDWVVGNKITIAPFMACVIAPSVFPKHAQILGNMPKRFERPVLDKVFSTNKKYIGVIHSTLGVQATEVCIQNQASSLQIRFKSRFCYVKQDEHKSNRCEYVLFYNKHRLRLDVYCRCLDAECSVNTERKYIPIDVDTDRRIQAEHILQ